MLLRNCKKIIYYWLPPLVWMAMIFYASSRTKISVSDEYFVNFLIFKSLHVAEYAFLYFLLFRAFYSLKNKKLTGRLIYPAILSILYAFFDEIHQSFVPTREGRLRDVIIDALGISIMYIYIKSHIDFIKRFI